MPNSLVCRALLLPSSILISDEATLAVGGLPDGECFGSDLAAADQDAESAGIDGRRVLAAASSGPETREGANSASASRPTHDHLIAALVL